MRQRHPGDAGDPVTGMLRPDPTREPWKYIVSSPWTSALDTFVGTATLSPAQYAFIASWHRSAPSSLVS